MARGLRNGCRNQNSMAMSCVWTVTTLLAWEHPDRPLANTPFPVHRPPDPSITETGPLTPSTGTPVRLRLTPVVHALGPKPRPWAPRAIHASARAAPTPATLETVLQLLFLLYIPGGGLQIGRRLQNNCSVTPAFGGTAPVAELPMFALVHQRHSNMHFSTSTRGP